MNRNPTRKPSLIDAMILVAAAAVGFAGFRAEDGDHYHAASLYILWESDKDSHILLNWTGSPPAWEAAVWRLVRWIPHIAPIAASLTLAMLSIRLRRPRPPWIRLARQPGFVAELAVAVVMGANLLLGLAQVALAMLGLSAMRDPRFYQNASFLVCRAVRVGPIGWGVVASWALLVATRRWRREPGWVDNMGIAIGLGWIGLLLGDWTLNAYQ